MDKKSIFEKYKTISQKTPKTANEADQQQSKIHDLVEAFFGLKRYSTQLHECDILENKMIKEMETNNDI